MHRVLYHNDIAVCAQKVRLVLAEKNLDYKGVDLNLRAGESHTPEYLKLNPKGVVPTLVENGVPIIESSIINEYLDDKYPEPPLRPANEIDRARMRRWIMKTDTGLLDVCANVSVGIAFRHQEMSRQLAARSEQDRNAWIERNEAGLDYPPFQAAIIEYGKVIDEMALTLKDQAWLAGDTFSLADCAILPYIRRLDNLALGWMWTDDPARQPLMDWYNRCRDRKSFGTAIIKPVSDEKLQFLRKHGVEARPAIEKILGRSK